MTLTTDKASRTSFTLTRLKKGYSTEEVDAFMQEVVAALRSWETGTAVGALPPADGSEPAEHDSRGAGASYGVLTSRDVTSKIFTSTRFRNAYEPDQVDAFMREAAAALLAWETGTVVGAPQKMLTAQDVMDAKFQASSKFGEGYEQDEVDEFLDDVAGTLRAWEASGADGASRPDGAPPGALTSEAVANKMFQVTRFREGYEQDEVDELLDTIMRVLRDYEARSGH